MFKELENYRGGLQAYIEATYHLSDPSLVAARRALLERPGTIAQRPFLESTARYATDRSFEELSIPSSAKGLLTSLAHDVNPPLVFDPPYAHQAEALEVTLGAQRGDLVVTTGTGSGKTETFLLPLLGRLYDEAATRPASFAQRGLRALVLYPMNALVNDQLARLRLLFGSPEVVAAFQSASPGGRPPKFARYTGRTLYPGVRTKERNQRRLKALRFYIDQLKLVERGGEGAEQAEALINALQERGKWPAKPDFKRWFDGDDPRRRWEAEDGTPLRAIERPEDAELLLRHEVHDAVPDLLLTNYSMLEYTLLRPLERPIWRQAREYYAANPSERLILVLDEAHLYRGASGTEVAMLLRRLRERLGIGPDRLQVICTSASFSGKEAAKTFAAGLVGKEATSFVVPEGVKIARSPAGPGDAELSELLAGLELSELQHERLERRGRATLPLLARRADALSARRLVVTCSRGSAQVRLSGLAEGLEEATEVVTVAPGQAVTSARAWLLPWSASADGELEGGASVRISWDGGGALYDGGSELQLTSDPLPLLLYAVLSREAVVGRLVNLTSGAESDEDGERDEPGHGPAQDLELLGGRLFPSVTDDDSRRRATDTLAELCGMARAAEGAAPLLAARVHAFFRGLPGLWVCLDDECDQLAPEQEGESPAGALYAQPRERCECGARVLELHTCRRCGLAVAVGYSPEPLQPSYLWADEGGGFSEGRQRLHKVHVALEEPAQGARAAMLDPVTGRLDSVSMSARDVWPAHDPSAEEPAVFTKCPRCNEQGRRISDHQTRGDQPFQELVSSQLLEQPPRPDSHTPLRGRKVLIFSDGRQAASRLSGNLKSASIRDAARPLLLLGFKELERRLGAPVSLDHTYAALLVGCAARGVTLRPMERQGQSFAEDLETTRDLLALEPFEERDFLAASGSLSRRAPEDVLLALFLILSNRFTGLESLGLAAPRVRVPRAAQVSFAALPAPAGPDRLDEDARRAALLDLWVREALRAGMLKLPETPIDWLDNSSSARVRRTKGGFSRALKEPLGSRFFNANFLRSGRRARPWLAWIQRHLGEDATANGFFLKPDVVTLDMSDEVRWRRCRVCTTLQPDSLLHGTCVSCGQGALEDVEAGDEVVEARTGYYRRLMERAEADPEFSPHPFVAEEHSAQINQAMEGEVFSRTERYELRFQDVDVADEEGRARGPIDALSCTTTMEVGIDIGSLTGVALRNVPPGRANYQQRAGRAGRRGSSLATVVTFAGADSHDQRFFNDPEGMVSGSVQDPSLNLRNREIVRRHVFALLLSMFQQARIPDEEGGASPNLFMSLGRLADFKRGDDGEFSFRGLKAWLTEEADAVRRAVEAVLPPEVEVELGDDPVAVLSSELLVELAAAGAGPSEAAAPEPEPDVSVEEEMDGWEIDGLDDVDDLEDFGGAGGGSVDEEPAGDTGTFDEEPLSQDLLLDRLFAKAVLPRYAFPTDVVSFHVFDEGRSKPFDLRLRYSPQQGLTAALSQYAPGREVWVDGRRWYSMAIWEPSPGGRDRWAAYRRQQLYFECVVCGFAQLRQPSGDNVVGATRDCLACGRPGGMGPALRWFTPPGFAHPVDVQERLPDGSAPPFTRPTRAKLSAPYNKVDEPVFQREGGGGAGARAWVDKADLLVTNVGNPDRRRAGFLYCLNCGRAEPNGWSEGVLRGQAGHPKPAPAFRLGEPKTCQGRVLPVSLGHVFRTDLSLFRLRLADGLQLDPGGDTARIAMRTIAEAIAIAAADADMLDLDPGEVAADWRVAQTAAGQRGQELEVYLYDQVAGGAGYARMAAEATEPSLLEHALAILDGCPEGCTSSCYQCLRSYQNRWLHGDLDRHLGADLLRHCLEGWAPSLEPDAVTRRLEVVARHLEDDRVVVERAEDHLRLPDHGGRRIYISHPLAPDVPCASGPLEGEHVALNQLQVDRALPSACLLALRGQEQAATDPFEGLTIAERGVPVFEPDDLAAGWGAATPPRSYADVPGAPDGSFIVRLEADTLEKLTVGSVKLRRGVWLLCQREDDAVALDRPTLHLRRPRLLIKRGGAFQATARPWSFAVGRHNRRRQTEDLVQIVYASDRDLCDGHVPVSKIGSVGVVLRPLGG